jgi:hypothetical protein
VLNKASSDHVSAERNALKRGTRGRDNQPAREDRDPEMRVSSQNPFAKPVLTSYAYLRIFLSERG